VGNHPLKFRVPDPFATIEGREKYIGNDLVVMNLSELVAALGEARMALTRVRKGKSISWWRSRLNSIESLIGHKEAAP